MNVKMDGRTWEQLLFILLQEHQHSLHSTDIMLSDNGGICVC